QLAIPFGGGLRFALNDNIRIGAELGLRKLFTDYLDDVSTVYADQNELMAFRGPEAVELAYRGDELQNSTLSYPAAGAQRGGAKLKDWYYFTGINISLRIGSKGTGGGFGNKRMRSEEHTSELQSREKIVCRLLLEKKKNDNFIKILI